MCKGNEWSLDPLLFEILSFIILCTIERTLARPFTVSDLPVPAGPIGEPPRFKCMAVVRVR